jgi:hypothetical protein
MSASSSVPPSALDTIFDVTTTTSLSVSVAADATIAARSSPGAISGNPSTGVIVTAGIRRRYPSDPAGESSWPVLTCSNVCSILVT